MPAIQDNMDDVGLRVTGQRRLGPHYWRTQFLDGWDRVAAAGFDPVFRRMWDFSLSYCEAGFRSRYLDAWQVGMVKP